MKNSTVYSLRVLLAIAAFGAISTAHAEDAPVSKEKKAPPAVLKKFDANNDGVLDEKEKAAWEADKAQKKAAEQAKRLEKWDANKDGKLDETEIAAEKAAKKEHADKMKAGKAEKAEKAEKKPEAAK